MKMNAIEKIITTLKSFEGDNIEGKFNFQGDSVEFTINSTTFVFDRDGDLIMTITS